MVFTAIGIIMLMVVFFALGVEKGKAAAYTAAAAPRMILGRIVAPLGKVVVILLLLATFFTTWGMMRQLSRVRSIPWITSSTRPVSFGDR